MASFLNSTSTPLIGSASWEGSLENCKNYSAISINLLSDRGCAVSILHLDKVGTILWADEYQTTSNTAFFKQVLSKATHFKVTVLNESVSDQTVLKLVTKLSNSVPDDINVKVTLGDSIISKLTTGEGDLSSDSGKLLVKQNVLVPASDGVLAYGLHVGSGDKVALNVDADGMLNMHASVATGSSFLNTTLTHTPVEVVGAGAKVMRIIAFNDSAQLRYLRLYDANALPAFDDNPKCVLTLKADDSFSSELGITCATGVWIVASSNHGALAAYGTVNADEVSVNVVYE